MSATRFSLAAVWTWILAGAVAAEAPGPMLAKMLAGPMAGVDEIVFAQRVSSTDHWYGNFGFYATSVAEYPPQEGLPDEQIPPLFGEGARLCRLDLRTGRRTVLLDDPTGGVRDPQVHYDGRRILFSYRKGGQPYYHLYVINVDGSGLVQLTDSPYDDIEPAWLPDDSIVFGSSRCRRWVNCHRTPVATLYRCDADGRNVRPLSTNVEHDNTPWVLPDGRVLFMRWEYVDRSQFAFHHLWTVNPDGTGQMVFYGNQFDGVVMLDAKPIPNSRKVVASFSPGHGMAEHMGAITIVDPRFGPDDRAAARQVSRAKQHFRDPYPFSEDCFLVADKTGILVMDGQGNVEPVLRREASSKMDLHEPRPLAARPREPAMPSRIDPAQSVGRFFLSDVHHGRNLAGVKRGDVKKLLVLEQLPKPVNFSGGMWPTSDGGTFTLARILGTVPVEADGSAYFEAPALRSVFFVALDESDLSVKRMQSFVSLQPGETAVCVGCHEMRTQTPLGIPASASMAHRRPHRIEPIAAAPDVFDFPRDIQPILDRHCVTCHDSDVRLGGVDLCGDRTPLFSVSYHTILERGLIADGRNERFGNRAPRTIGSSASKLLEYVEKDHYDVALSQRERVRLRLWIDSSAVFAGTYAALGSGLEPVVFPIATIERRCGQCHGSTPKTKARIGEGLYFRFGPVGPALPLVHAFLDLQRIRGSIGYYKSGTALPPQALCNLTRPWKSLLVQAPLAKSAGGLGLCSSAVFRGTSDPDYATIVAAIAEAGARLDAHKRFDMPGFRPNVYYVRQMQRYGILPPDLKPDGPIDPYATDHAYWRSFWYHQ